MVVGLVEVFAGPSLRLSRLWGPEDKLFVFIPIADYSLEGRAPCSSTEYFGLTFSSHIVPRVHLQVQKSTWVTGFYRQGPEACK